MSPRRIIAYVERRPWRTVLLLIAVAGLAAGVGFAIDTANTATDAARKADQAAKEAKHATVQIQAERVRSILASCETQNERNRIAYAFLKSLPASPNQPKRSPEEQERLLRGFTDALVGPVRDCAVVIAQTAPSAPAAPK